jgi:hypothetical protein
MKLRLLTGRNTVQLRGSPRFQVRSDECEMRNEKLTAFGNSAFRNLTERKLLFRRYQVPKASRCSVPIEVACRNPENKSFPFWPVRLWFKVV